MTDFEYILRDDGSTDNSLQIMNNEKLCGQRPSYQDHDLSLQGFPALNL